MKEKPDSPGICSRVVKPKDVRSESLPKSTDSTVQGFQVREGVGYEVA